MEGMVGCLILGGFKPHAYKQPLISSDSHTCTYTCTCTCICVYLDKYDKHLM